MDTKNNNTNCVLLLAGYGKRLGIHKNKCLIKIGRCSLLHRTLCMLTESGIHTQNTRFVLGYNKEKLISLYPSIQYVTNYRYKHTQTAVSLYLATRNQKGPVLWLNGDLYIHTPQHIIKQIQIPKKYSYSICSQELTDPKDDVKISLNPDGSIKAIGKNISPPIAGKAVGINYISAQHLQIFNRVLRHAGTQHLFEYAMQCVIKMGVKIYPVWIPKGSIQEIDTPKDLDRAKKLSKSGR